jgi:hypothetical protein
VRLVGATSPGERHEPRQRRGGGKRGMTIILLLVYLFIGLTVYAVTDTRSMTREIESRNLLVTFGEVDRVLTVFAIALWPLWLILYLILKK